MTASFLPGGGSSIARIGFTLVELLVVMAIIIILLGLLIPIIGKVRSHAQQVVCGSRLRQCGMAMFAYQSDYSGWPKVEGGLALIYPHVAAPIGYPNIPNALKEYAGGAPNIFYCPQNSRSPTTHWPTMALGQYSMTYQFIPWGNPAGFLVPVPNYRDPTPDMLLMCDTEATNDAAHTSIVMRNHKVGAGVSGMNALYGDGHVNWKPATGTWTNWYRDSANKFYWWALGW